jgi:hypothetical protein
MDFFDFASTIFMIPGFKNFYFEAGHHLVLAGFPGWIYNVLNTWKRHSLKSVFKNPN